MPYVIAFVIIIIAAGALLLFRQPADMPATTNTDPAVEASDQMQPESQNDVPEGFASPTTPPPTSPDDQEVSTSESETTTEADNNTDNDFDPADDQRTFSAEASYFTPARKEHEMLVTLTLKDRVVVDADVSYDNTVASTPQHTAFDSAYKSEVIGKQLNDISLSRVGGASLTSAAFNEAVEKIQTQRS